MTRRMIPSWLANSMIACLFFSVSFGNLMLEAHQARPGASGGPTGEWPIDTPLRLDRTRPSLLIFLHPKCPCSQASLAELAQIMSRCRGRVSAKAVVYRSVHSGLSWRCSETGLEQDLTDLPGVSFCYDDDGVEARRFGISTSGHVLLFDETGRRIFGGGITSDQGHEGENRSRDELIDRILNSRAVHEAPLCSDTAIFGCPIFAPNRADSKRS